MRETLSRRSLFRSGVRAALAAGLGALGFLSFRKGRGQGADHTCSGSGICRGCGLVSKCILPQAASYKKAARKGRG